MSSSSVQIPNQPSKDSPGAFTPRSSSDSTAPSAGSSASFDIVRCSRCQRSLSLDSSSSPGVVRFGVNSYYCSRCAAMVGFNRWIIATEFKPTKHHLRIEYFERENTRTCFAMRNASRGTTFRWKKWHRVRLIGSIETTTFQSFSTEIFYHRAQITRPSSWALSIGHGIFHSHYDEKEKKLEFTLSPSSHFHITVYLPLQEVQTNGRSQPYWRHRNTGTTTEDIPTIGKHTRFRIGGPQTWRWTSQWRCVHPIIHLETLEFGLQAAGSAGSEKAQIPNQMQSAGATLHDRWSPKIPFLLPSVTADPVTECHVILSNGAVTLWVFSLGFPVAFKFLPWASKSRCDRPERTGEHVLLVLLSFSLIRPGAFDLHL